MPRFRIRPLNSALAPIDIVGQHVSTVLNIVKQREFFEAHVDHNGSYSFSARLSAAGFWTIYQLPLPGRAVMIAVS